MKILRYFLICLVILFVADTLIEKSIHAKKEIAVPMVEKLTVKEAQEILEKARFVVQIESEIYSRKLGSGRVVAQYPMANAIVRQGKIIKLVISKGGESIEIPNVVGMSQRAAEIELKNNGAIIGQEEFVYSLALAEGCVVSQNPAAGNLMAKGSFVNLKISKGVPKDETIKIMPQVVGMFFATAEEALVRQQIEFNVIYRLVKEEDKQDVVLSQKPEGDTVLADSEKVQIEVGQLK